MQNIACASSKERKGKEAKGESPSVGWIEAAAEREREREIKVGTVALHGPI